MSSFWSRGLWPLALFLPHIASVGCSEQTTYEPYDVSVAPASGRIATGATTLVKVGVESHGRDEDFDGYCGPSPAFVDMNIEGADCKPDCVANITKDGVLVTSGSAGTKTVDVSTRTSDNKTQRHFVTVTFADPTRLFVERDPSQSPSGTKQAMVLGDHQRWTIGIGDEEGALDANLCAALSWSAGGAISAPATCNETGSGFAIELTADHVGAGSLDIHYLGLTRSTQLVVVDPAHAKSVTLLDAGKSDPTDKIDVDKEAELAAAPSPLVFRYLCADEPAKGVVARLVMDDGTIALGGPALLRASSPAALSLQPFEQAAFGQVLVPTDGALFGTFGAVELDAPYVVRTGCSKVDEPVDSGAPDASSDADAGGDADAAVDGGDR